MKIKSKPEDFVVEEIPIKFDNKGEYGIYKLHKTSTDTEEAVQKIAQELKIDRKRINYAGQKDKTAETTQYISIKNFTDKIQKQYGNITLTFETMNSQPLNLGILEGNKFTITARNLPKKHEIHDNNIIPNYFGEQRFSQNNHDIGLALIKKDFRKACELLQEDNQHKKAIQDHLAKKENDYIGVITKLPRNNIRFYIHSFQSRIFNKLLADYIKKEFPEHNTIEFRPDNLVMPNSPIPERYLQESIKLIGFDSELVQEETNVIEAFHVTKKDFIIKQLPNLSTEGSTRPAFTQIKGFTQYDIEEDEMFEGKYKRKIQFTLDKGSYATIAIRCLISETLEQ